MGAARRTGATAFGLIVLAASLRLLAPEPSAPDDKRTGAPPEPGTAVDMGASLSDEAGSPASAGRPMGPAGTVSSGTVATVDPEDQDLVRLPPRENHADRSSQNDPGEREIRLRLLPLVIVEGADRITHGKGVLRLEGVTALPIDARCGRAQTPCGRVARTAVRNYVGRRSVRCPVPSGFGEMAETVTVRCTVAGQDLGAWIVGQGWAEAEASGPYGDLEAEARRSGRGLWR